MMPRGIFLILSIMPLVDARAGAGCTVEANSGAYGTTLDTVYIDGKDYKELDDACCAACGNNPECTFWIRSTEYAKQDYCWLMNEWDGNYPYSYYRVGRPHTFVGNLPCEALKFAYSVLGNILSHVSIHLGTVVTNLKLDLPSDNLQCEIASDDDNTNQLFYLKNIAFTANASFNLTGVRDDPLDIGEGAFGTAQVAINVDPEFSVDVQECWPEVAKLNLWNLGIGLNNFGNYQWWSQWLSGDYRSGLKSMKMCNKAVAALPGLELIGYQVGYIRLEPSTQEDADRACCQACDNMEECEGFLVDDYYYYTATNHNASRSCWLYRLSYPNKNRHSNFRGETVTLGEVGMYHGAGWRVGYHVMADTQTQEEKDRHCGELCLETKGCYWWSTSVSGPYCWLHYPFNQVGLFNKGILGISGKSIGNNMVNGMIWRMLKKVLSYICGNNAIVDINRILHLSSEVFGEGEFMLDVAEDFFSTADFSKEFAWGNATFPLLSAKTNIRAHHADVQPLVDDLVSDLHSSFAGEVAHQMGSPIGFFIGSIISECMADKGTCMQSGVDVNLVV